MPRLSANDRSSTAAPIPPWRKSSIPLASSVTHSTRNDSEAEPNWPKISAAASASAMMSRTRTPISFEFVCFAVPSSILGICGLIWNKALIVFAQLGGVRGHKPQHLLLQLCIYFIRYRHNIGKPRVEIQTPHVFVQHRKNGDLEQAGFLDRHGYGVPLFAAQVSVEAGSFRNRSSSACVQTQPRDHIMQKLRKMACAFVETRRNRRQVWLLVDARKPIFNHFRKFTLEDVRHTLN